MNQLSWYADRNTGVHKKFTYDDAGNITKVQNYSFAANSENGIR